MRKIPAALAILGLATVGLAGCSLPGSSDCPRPTSDTTSLDLVEVTGSTDAAPEVEVYTPFHATEGEFADLEQGDGDVVITSADQLVVLDVTLISGETGETIQETAYDGDLSQSIPMSQWTQVLPPFEDALRCTSAGSRVAIAIAPGDIDAETAASLGLAEDESAVAVIDVRKVYLGAADGRDQFNSGTGLPSVVRAPDGHPGLIIPEGAPPSDVVVQTIKKGDGPVVEGDVPVRVHVLEVSWDDKAEIRSTWDTQPESIVLEGAVLEESLVGQTVGSQVMVVVPADQGGTDQATVFVYDILGLDPAAP